MTITKNGDAYAIIKMEGKFIVTSTATVGEGYALDLSNAVLNVPGTLTISKLGTAPSREDAVSGGKLQSADGAVIDIDGRLNKTGFNFITAMYLKPTTTGTTAIFTSLEKAVPAAVLDGIYNIDVGGIPATVSSEAEFAVVTEDISVPSGMFISGPGIIIGTSDNTPEDAPEVYIASGAGFAFTTITVEEGLITVANTIDVNEDTIYADVKVVDNTKFTGSFMSLRIALAAAGEGDFIQLSQDFEGVDRDLIIPKGVTVSAIDDDKGDKYFSVINANLVVNGTLIVDEFKFLATTDDTKTITVNGTIMDRHSSGKCFAPCWYVPDGVSYKWTIPDGKGSDETWYVITSIDNLQNAIFIADDSKVTIEGNPKLGDVSIYGTDDEPAEVTFSGNVRAGTITIDNVIIKALNGKRIDATIADAKGSITIRGAYVDNKLSIYSLGENGVFMAGAITDETNGTYFIQFDGTTGIDGTNKSTIGWGHAADGADPTIIFNGETTAVGKKVVIENNVAEGAPSDGIVTVIGSLIAGNNNKLVMNSDVQVLGKLIAKERDGNDNPGSIEINGDLFVGAYMGQIFDPLAAVQAYEKNLPLVRGEYVANEYGYPVTTTGTAQAVAPVDNSAATTAAAYVSGKVDVDATHFITVLDGSTIDPAIIEDLESLDVIINNNVWLTVYSASTNPRFSMDGLKAPIVDAKVDTIVDAAGNVVAYFDHEFRVIYGSAPAIDMKYNDAIEINLDFNVFTVEIKTDGSVKAVYIDGILMRTGQNANIFLLDKIATGTHEVKVEPAAGYTADGCILYTDSDEPVILKDMKFTFTEYDCEDYMVTYNIKGTQVEPEPVPPTPEEESQWTITTILLVILVVLIAIMAVIVALRLNRS
jgi:hypothetical protein